MATCQDFAILVNHVLQGVWSCSLFIAWCTAWAKLRQMTVMADVRGKARLADEWDAGCMLWCHHHLLPSRSLLFQHTRTLPVCKNS
jgi:hypothetical protein